MNLHVDEVVAEIEAVLEPLANPEQAGPMAAYMRDQFSFLGIKTPERRAAVKPIMMRGKTWTATELLDVAEALMAQPEREFSFVATELLRKWRATLRSEDLTRIRGLIQTKSWWDTVDGLAVHTLGSVVLADRSLQGEMDRWIHDDDIWVARSAILHQLMWKDQIDAERLFRYCDIRADDTEFFIRKAIGWALRQHARTDPNAVRDYVDRNVDRLSGLSKREALKHIG